MVARSLLAATALLVFMLAAASSPLDPSDGPRDRGTICRRPIDPSLKGKQDRRQGMFEGALERLEGKGESPDPSLSLEAIKRVLVEEIEESKKRAPVEKAQDQKEKAEYQKEEAEVQKFLPNPRYRLFCSERVQ
jgi:hypothetical protein